MSAATRCPSCGYLHTGDDTERSLSLADPGDEILPLLSGAARVGACRNDGQPFDRYAIVQFTDGDGFTVVLDETGDPAGFAAAIRARLEIRASQAWSRAAPVVKKLRKTAKLSLGSQIVRTLLELHREASVTWPTRAELAALILTMTGEPLVGPLALTRAAYVAMVSMNAPGDTPAALDEAIPAWFLTETVRGRLAPEEEFDVPVVWTNTLDLVAAWAADRHGTRLPDRQRLRFSRYSVAWVDSHGPQAEGLGPPDFLQRALDAAIVELAIDAIQRESPPDAARVTRVFTAWYVIEDFDALRRTTAMLGTQERERQAAAIAIDSDLAEPTRIMILHALEDYDRVTEVFRTRLGTLPPTEAADMAAMAIEAFEQSGQFERAHGLLQEYLRVHPSHEWTALPAPAEVRLRNVAGNTLRGIGAPLRALIEYTLAALRLAEPGITAAGHWLVHGNAARCLGYLGQHKAAFHLALQLAENVPLSAWEQHRVLIDLARYAECGGLHEYAHALLLAAWDGMRVESDFGFKRPELLLGLARTASYCGNHASALEFARQAATFARDQHLADDEATALIEAATAARALGDPAWSELARQAEPLIRPGRLTARADLAALRGDRRTLAKLALRKPGLGPRQLTALAGLLLDEGKLTEARVAIGVAWALELADALRDDDIDARDVDLFHGLRWLRDLTARHALAAYSAAHPPGRTREGRRARNAGRDAGELLLRAAELDGTLLGSYLAWPPDARPSAERLSHPDWLDICPPEVTILFAVRAADTVSFVVRDRVGCSVVMEWPTAELEAVRSQVSAATKRGSPRGDPLARCFRWTAFAAALGAAVEPYLVTSQHLLFLFGAALGDLPLHLLPTSRGPVIDLLPCSYAASLLQLAGLAERRRRAPAGAGSRAPGIVSVYRGTERPETAAAFTDGVAAWRGLLKETSAVPPRVLAAGDATPEAALALFADVDLLLLSCHGLANPRQQTHSLALAADGQLPPSIMRAASDDSDPAAPRYLLAWDAIVGGTPAVVLSAACSSASASVTSSGERISLDRALFVNGTATFIGPLWDVSVADAHTFIATVLGNARSHGMSWADAWRRAIADCRATMAPATWHSFVLIGDWTTT
jgi:hypothetical protein